MCLQMSVSTTVGLSFATAKTAASSRDVSGRLIDGWEQLGGSVEPELIDHVDNEKTALGQIV
jgi:hypothetical protein